MNSKNSPFFAFKHCPNCGKSDIKSETGKSLRCAECGFRYFFNMGAAVAAIIRNENDEVLFTIRKNDPSAGMLDLPGGFVDMGESAENALKREILEELNLETTTLEYLGSFPNRYNFENIEYQTLDLVFECTVESFQTISAADDVSSFIFKHPDQIVLSEIGLNSIKDIVEKHILNVK